MRLALPLLFAALTALAAARAQNVTMKHGRIPLGVTVGRANKALFNTPIFTYRGGIYVAFVRKDPEDDKRYQTVVGKYAEGEWDLSVVEPNNLNDPWHAQPSLAVDTDGYVHVTYNMHSSPWQYSVSARPEDISEWEFRGQELKGPHDRIKSGWGIYEARAAIPGLRITYQTMHVDRNGVIYIAYREAGIYRGVAYHQQQWSLGISKYDAKTKTWKRVGPNPNVKTSALGQTFATEPGKRAQGAKIYFDPDNRMHVSWTWYAEYEKDGSGHRKPNWATYAYSDDGGDTFFRADGRQFTLPITVAQTDVIVPPSWVEPNEKGYYFAYTEVCATPDGTPFVWIMPRDPPKGKGRAIVFYEPGEGWGEPVPAPYAATRMVVDDNGVITMISSGLRVHRTYDRGKTWKKWEIDTQEGAFAVWPDYSYTPQTNQLRFLAGNKAGELFVYTVEFSDAPRPVAPIWQRGRRKEEKREEEKKPIILPARPRPVAEAPREDGTAPLDDTEDPELRRLLKDAETLFIEGEMEKAGELFKRIVDEHPDTPSAAKAREFLEILE